MRQLAAVNNNILTYEATPSWIIELVVKKNIYYGLKGPMSFEKKSFIKSAAKTCQQRTDVNLVKY